MSVHIRTLEDGQVFDVRWRDAEGQNRSRAFDTAGEAERWDEAVRVGRAYVRARNAWAALTPEQRAMAEKEIGL